MGCHDISSGREWSRQLSTEEAQNYSIAVHEARALLFCVQNITLDPKTTRVLRLHCGKNVQFQTTRLISPNIS